MAEETSSEAPVAVGRFRLPKLFADPNSSAHASDEAVPDAAPGIEANEANGANGTSYNGASANGTSHHGTAAESEVPTSPAAIIFGEIGQIRDGMELMYGLLSEIHQRETSQEKVFDTLYGELRDYKNDFIYEHLKPVVRPLLFLFDSLEQFDQEIAVQERPDSQERRGLSPSLVRENIAYFREQLVEALRICEVTQMEAPEGPFNAKLHKAIEVVAVEPEMENTVQRVVRSGWFLNGQLLRPAEVAVGKSK